MNKEEYMDKWYQDHPDCTHKEYLDESRKLDELEKAERGKLDKNINSWFGEQVGKYFKLKSSRDGGFCRYGRMVKNIDCDNAWFGLIDLYTFDGISISYYKDIFPINKFWFDCPYVKKSLYNLNDYTAVEVSKEEYEKFANVYKNVNDLLETLKNI